MTLHVADRLRGLPRREPVLTDPSATLRRVAHTLWPESVGMAVVGDAHHPRGGISERDVVAALAQGADPSGPCCSTPSSGGERGASSEGSGQ